MSAVHGVERVIDASELKQETENFVNYFCIGYQCYVSFMFEQNCIIEKITLFNKPPDMLCDGKID